MLITYRNIEPHIIHLWYVDNDALDFHGSFVNHKYSKLFNKKTNMWLSIKVGNSLSQIESDATEVYIHGTHRFCIDLVGFNSLRKIEILERYKYCLVNIRQPTITIVASYLPSNIKPSETPALINKLVNVNGVLKHFIKIRTAYLIEPPQSKEKILLR